MRWPKTPGHLIKILFPVQTFIKKKNGGMKMNGAEKRMVGEYQAIVNSLQENIDRFYRDGLISTGEFLIVNVMESNFLTVLNQEKVISMMGEK